MDALCVVLVVGLSLVVLAYLLLELHYFVRMAFCVLRARVFGKRQYILDQTNYMGICLTTDLDSLLYHMNNARYLRELDFARVDFYERTHLYRAIVAHGGAVVQGASTIRYRRFIRPFRTYRITSRIVYWDEQSIYMEHQFVSPRDGFVHCVALCRQRVIDCSAANVIAELLQQQPVGKAPTTTTTTTADSGTPMTQLNATVSGGAAATTAGKMLPDLTPEVAKWIEYNDLSSASLRQTV